MMLRVFSIAPLTSFLLIAGLSAIGEALECQGPYRGGGTPTREALQKVLEEHLAWIEAGRQKADLRRANLCGANLGKVAFDRTDLRGADLSQANLREARFVGANLQAVFMTGADLRRADLSEANLNDANMHSVDLRGALIGGTSLRKTLLLNADLRGAWLVDADLSQSYLNGANLALTLFEPLVNSLADVGHISYAKNLSQTTFRRSPQAMLALREGFKRAGLRAQEREVTFAIKHTERLKAEWLERAFSLTLFELTCQWGMSPGRPLRILLALIPLFTIPYALALKARGRAGIWLVWAADRVHQDEGQKEPVRVTPEFFLASAGLSAPWWRRLIRYLGALGVALYFSVLSAFHVGWRELNVGTWIARLQPREYSLRPTGWVRTVSGLQSLISVYLLALWALTYFGRPFE